MTCKDLEPLLGDLVDGRLAGEAREHAEAHVQSCADCGGLVADLRQIREAARHLPRIAPPADGWARLNAALDAESHARGTAAGPAPGAPAAGGHQGKVLSWRPTRPAFWGALAAAAVLVLATAAALLMFSSGTPVNAPGAATQPAAGAGQAAAHPEGADLVQSVESELQLAEQHYQNAIAGLEQIAKEGQSSLDPQVASVLAKNMGVIEQSIRDSRDALKAQPTSELAQASLFEGLRRKVDLLKDTVALINEMRKGNEAGAAQILGKS
jgi:anti-sigma factor RsiW